MALFSISEIFDMILMTAAIGFIFKDSFQAPKEQYDPVKYYSQRFRKDDFMFAISVVAPAILLHELGHKFVALSFGLSATFQAAYTFLILGIVLKMLNFPFIFFVPAYVSIAGGTSTLLSGLTALAGPFVNLILWLSCALYLRQGKPKRKHIHFLQLTRKINMFLFIFNMLPIPGFDGFQVIKGLIQYAF